MVDNIWWTKNGWGEGDGGGEILSSKIRR